MTSTNKFKEGDRVVRDPPLTRSKGAVQKPNGRTRKQYKYKMCQSYGHNSKSCVKKIDNNGDRTIGDDRLGCSSYADMEDYHDKCVG